MRIIRVYIWCVRAFLLRLRRQGPSLILSAVLLSVALGACVGPDGPRDLLALIRRNAALAAHNQQLSADNLRLTNEVARLQSDDVYIRRMIRLKLGYIEPGEIVYRFRSGPPS